MSLNIFALRIGDTTPGVATSQPDRRVIREESGQLDRKLPSRLHSGSGIRHLEPIQSSNNRRQPSPTALGQLCRRENEEGRLDGQQLR